MPTADPDGLMYSAMQSDGVLRIGWLCREDEPSYDDLGAWHDALRMLDDPPGLQLLSIRRMPLSEFRDIAMKAASLP